MADFWCVLYQRIWLRLEAQLQVASHWLAASGEALSCLSREDQDGFGSDAGSLSSWADCRVFFFIFGRGSAAFGAHLQ